MFLPCFVCIHSRGGQGCIPLSYENYAGDMGTNENRGVSANSLEQQHKEAVESE